MGEEQQIECPGCGAIDWDVMPDEDEDDLGAMCNQCGFEATNRAQVYGDS